MEPVKGVPTPEETVMPEETAKVVITVCDGGQHGFMSCGKCGATLEDDASHPRCPECGIKLVGTESGPSFGGSDF